MRSEEEKRRVLESCHAGVDGMQSIIITLAAEVFVNVTILSVFTGCHLGRDKTLHKSHCIVGYNVRGVIVS